jgi:hypothetical protein
MSTEALLAIMGLVCTVVPLLPEERRRDILVRLLTFDLALIAAVIIALHVIKFYPLLYENHLVPATGPWRFGLNAESASYLILLTASGIVGLRIWLRPLAASRLPTFHALIETQLRTRQYSHLAALLQRHWDRLVTLHHPDGTLGARIFQRLDTRPDVRSVVDGIPAIRSVLLRPKGVHWARTWLAHLFAGAERRAYRIDDIFALALRSDEFVAHLAAAELPLALRILSYPTQERDAFQERLFESLLSDSRSAFYQELRHNTNLRGGARYALPAQHRVLRHYLADPRVAQELAVYRPIGEYALQWLSKQQRLDVDPCNLAWTDRFREFEAWRSPIHAAIRFFDIMVLEALHHRVSWHMWLYYFPSFVESILANMRHRDDVDYAREWPTPYHFLLYQLFSAIGSWIEEAARLSESDPSQGVVDVDLNHENGNIPKSAIIALGTCLRHVLMATQLTDRFKSYIVECTLRDLHRVQQHRNAAALSETLAQSLLRGGGSWFDSGGTAVYRAKLLEAFAGIDLIFCLNLFDGPGGEQLRPMVRKARSLGNDDEGHTDG